jgi:hypothetical protein
MNEVIFIERRPSVDNVGSTFRVHQSGDGDPFDDRALHHHKLAGIMGTRIDNILEPKHTVSHDSSESFHTLSDAISNSAV